MDKFPKAWKNWQQKVQSYGVELNDEQLMEIVHEYEEKVFDSFPIIFKQISDAASLSDDTFFSVYNDILDAFKNNIDPNIDVNWSSSRGSSELSGFYVTDEQHVEHIRSYYEDGEYDFLQEINRECKETGRDFFEVYTELKAKRDVEGAKK